MNSQHVSTRIRDLAPKCSFTIDETAEILGMTSQDLRIMLAERVLNGSGDAAAIAHLRLRPSEVIMLTLMGRPTPDRNPFAH